MIKPPVFTPRSTPVVAPKLPQVVINNPAPSTVKIETPRFEPVPIAPIATARPIAAATNSHETDITTLRRPESYSYKVLDTRYDRRR